MHETARKEHFSNAYLRAVAAAAGFAVYKPEPDIDKADWGIAAPSARGTFRSPRLEAQLKCTSQDVVKEDHIAFSVDLETFDNLRDETLMVPKILIVVVVPPNVSDWLIHSEERLALHRCGYWVCLSGQPPSTNQSDETIHIPRNQQFTVKALTEMMERISQGETP